MARRFAGVALAALVATLALASASGSAAATATLTQKSITAGCISEVETPEVCRDGVALDGAHGVAMSPDGESVYVTSFDTDGVAVFDRSAGGGLAGETEGSSSCISETGTGGACNDGKALDGPQSLSVSPDGSSVYVASLYSNAVAVLIRDRGTGRLTQDAGTAGCVSDGGSRGACIEGVALGFPTSTAVSPDGRNVYVTSFKSDAVAVFDRDLATGALTQKTGTRGCVSETGGICADGRALNGAHDVAVSWDGRNVYVASVTSGAVAVFDRDPATGVLRQKGGTAGCISETDEAGACLDGTALLSPRSLVVSPDGNSVYVASESSNAVAVFDRDRSSGALTQKTGTAGCTSATGTGGICKQGGPLDQAFDVVVSPDALSVYVTSSLGDGIAVFDRNPGDGLLTQKPRSGACVSQSGNISQSGSTGPCAVAHGLDQPRRLAASPDGATLYVASFASDSLTVFDRLPSAYDVDGDSEVEALTDGLLLIRHTFNFRGQTLVSGAVDRDHCTRCTAAEIEAFINSLLEDPTLE